MKYYSLVIAALLCVTTAQADPIDKEEAAMLASQYIPNGQAPKMVHAARRTKALRNIEANETSPLYIFSRGEGQGYVIVAGDNCINPIIGVVETGDYDPSTVPPALANMLDGWSQIIENAQQQGAPARTTPLRAAGTRDVPILLTSHWHQESPYNDKCPHMTNGSGRAMTGCVATAASQVAYYWRNDAYTEVQYDTPTYGYGGAPVTEDYQIKKGTPYNWDLMLDSYGGNTKQREAVATMVAALGMSTWLTYGDGSRATSGQISNLVSTFSGQFGLNSECWYKSGNSQAVWEKLVVEELTNYRPIVYSGVGSNGGHAIVCDGYRVNDNLFHFNFGWGGQGDGYFTLDDETGVGGYSGQQGMTFRIQPKKYNINALIDQKGFVQKADNKFKVKVENHSSIPYSGVYVFLGTSNPSIGDLSKATVKNLDTEIPKGESAEIEFTYKPSLLKPYIIVVCDRSGHILARDTAEVRAAAPDLHLNWLRVQDVTSSQEETVTVDGEQQTINVGTVYNTNVNIKTKLYNSPSGTYVQPSLKVELFTYDTENGTWIVGPTKINTATVFDTNDTQITVFPFNKLKENTLYKARLIDRVLTNTYYDIDKSCADSVAYFRVVTGSLAITGTENGRAILTGAWNVPAFNELAKDETINVYDLTQVDYFGGDCSELHTANPNALIYAAVQPTSGNNVVADGVCQHLSLVPGYDFTPDGSFRAKKATYKADEQTGIWTTVYLPFGVDSIEMPKDALVRNALQIQSGFFYTCDSVCRSIKPCTPYLVLPGRKTLTISATNAEITTNAENAYCTDFVGTFVNTPAIKNETFVLDEGTTQYFNTPATNAIIPALSGYIINNKKKVRANSYTYSTKDQSSAKLAKAAIAAQNSIDETECSEYAAYILSQTIESALEALYLQESKNKIDEAYKALQAATKAFVKNPMEEGEIPNAINSINATYANQKVYNLSGCEVKAMHRGVYIVGGRKILK